MRYEWIYVVVTVGIKYNSYRLLSHEPKHLKQNEFAYKMRIGIKEEEWRDRIAEVEMPPVKPTNLPKPEVMEIIVEKETPLKVLDRLSGR